MYVANGTFGKPSHSPNADPSQTFETATLKATYFFSTIEWVAQGKMSNRPEAAGVVPWEAARSPGPRDGYM